MPLQGSVFTTRTTTLRALDGPARNVSLVTLHTHTLNEHIRLKEAKVTAQKECSRLQRPWCCPNEQ